MIKNVLFDFSNVISVFAWDKYAVKVTGDRKKADYLLDMTLFNQDVWPDYDAGYIDEEEALKRFKAVTAPEWHGYIDEFIRGIDCCFYPLDGMYELVEELKANGIKCYVISNFPKDPFERVSRDFPTLKLMDGILVSYVDHLMKPEAPIFNEACRRWGLKPEECVFTDDMDYNVAGAEAVGMHGHVFKGADYFRRYLRKLGAL